MADGIKSCAAALVRAQRAFGPALKDKTNPAFRSRYADLGACVDAVLDALNANGIALVQRQHPHEGGVCVETIFLHESGEQISAGLLHVPAVKQDPQGYGSALTYARRYSLMAACGIAPEDDDGNAASSRPPAPRVMDPMRRDDFIASINDASTVDAARELLNAGLRAAHESGDKAAHDMIRAAGVARAKALGATVKAAA